MMVEKTQNVLEWVVILGLAGVVFGLGMIVFDPLLHDHSESVEQDSLSEYGQGFADGKIAGVFEDIKNANKYIEENCICGRDPYIDNPYLDKELKERPMPLPRIYSEPCEWRPAGDGCNECCGSICTVMGCGTVDFNLVKSINEGKVGISENIARLIFDSNPKILEIRAEDDSLWVTDYNGGLIDSGFKCYNELTLKPQSDDKEVEK